jgi:hypothetical protein
LSRLKIHLEVDNNAEMGLDVKLARRLLAERVQEFVVEDSSLWGLVGFVVHELVCGPEKSY